MQPSAAECSWVQPTTYARRCPTASENNFKLRNLHAITELISMTQCVRRAIAEAKQRCSVIGCRTINLLSRAPPCFRRHVKQVPAAFAVVSARSSIKDGWRQTGGWSYKYCRIFTTTWWKACCTDPTQWYKGRKKNNAAYFYLMEDSIFYSRLQNALPSNPTPFVKWNTYISMDTPMCRYL
jgi:hypothetical protein